MMIGGILIDWVLITLEKGKGSAESLLLVTVMALETRTMRLNCEFCYVCKSYY